MLHSSVGAKKLRVEAATLAEAIEAAFLASPVLRHHLCEDSGKFKPHVLCFLNENNTRDMKSLNVPLREGDEIVYLPAISGGVEAPSRPALLLAVVALAGCGGSGGSTPGAEQEFPASIFGGGVEVTIEVELTEPGDIHCAFATGNGYDVNKPKRLEVEKKLAAGKHTFNISMPKEVSVAPEVHIRPPNLRKGSRILIVLRRGSEELARDEFTSESDKLAPKTAFFVSLHVENAGG